MFKLCLAKYGMAPKNIDVKSKLHSSFWISRGIAKHSYFQKQSLSLGSEIQDPAKTLTETCRNSKLIIHFRVYIFGTSKKTYRKMLNCKRKPSF